MSDTPDLPKTKQQYASSRPKVEPFARFEGTSAWHKYRRRARAYARFRAAARQAAQSKTASNT